MSLTRRRILFFACLAGGAALALYGAHRWPAEYTRGRYDSKGTYEFVKAGSSGDRLLAALDFLGSALLIGGGLYLRYWKRFRTPYEDPEPPGCFLATVERLVALAGILAGGFMALRFVGAVVALFST